MSYCFITLMIQSFSLHMILPAYCATTWKGEVWAWGILEKEQWRLSATSASVHGYQQIESLPEESWKKKATRTPERWREKKVSYILLLQRGESCGEGLREKARRREPQELMNRRKRRKSLTFFFSR